MLEVLDLSYTDIKKLDLSNNPKLIWLQAYSGGEGYDDIAQLTEIDLSGKPNLQFADLKNNALATIDVSGNTALRQLIVNNNKLTTLDVSKNTALEVLRASGNLLPLNRPCRPNDRFERAWSIDGEPNWPAST